MTLPVRIERSPDPEATGGTRNRVSIAARIAHADEARIGAVLLLAATVVAVVWSNMSVDGYHQFWDTELSLRFGAGSVELTVHAIVNDALMAIFFFTVGLEVRREFAIGELTNWSRAIVPVAGALAGLVVPATIFVAFNLASGFAHAWGVVISTDTAFVMGALALIGPRAPGRLRVFLLALAVVDDIGALAIIALVYTENFTPMPLLVAALGLASIFATRYLSIGRGPIYVGLAVVVWLAFLASGVHPTLAGVAIALLIPVYRPTRRDVEQAVELTRAFRQSPNSRYAHAAANSLRDSISINERLSSAYAPYVSFIVLPLFALANAGVTLSPEIMLAAVRSPITWGVICGLVAGKFVGIAGSAKLLKMLRIGDFGPGLSIGRLSGIAALCGMGFTISLFIVDIAIQGDDAQNEARVGVLAASLIAFALAAVLFRITDASKREGESPNTLARPVDPTRDHISGPADAELTIVEYADFQCFFCLRASGSIDEVRQELGPRLRYVWRHAPLTRFHPNALAAAEAAEAAALQGEARFFEFGRSLFADQEHQQPSDLMRRAHDMGLDTERFEQDLRSAEVAGRVRDDMLDAEAMDITAVPTFFINGRRLTGSYDAQTLIRALLDSPTDDAPNAVGELDLPTGSGEQPFDTAAGRSSS